MIAYFVHNNETKTDTIYLPGRECCYTVNRSRMAEFLSQDLDFQNPSSDICIDVPPEEFGGVIALRDENGELRVLNPELWRLRLTAFMGNDTISEINMEEI